MDWLTWLKLLMMSAVVYDAEKKKWTVKIGPISIKDFTFRRATELADDPARIRSLLSEIFITRRVLWEDLSAERPEAVAASLLEISELCLKKLSEENTAEFAALLQALSNAAAEGAKVISQLLKDEKDPICAGDAPAVDYLPEILSAVREVGVPTALWLASFLPEDDPVRQQADEKFDRAKKATGFNFDSLQLSLQIVEDPKYKPEKSNVEPDGQEG